MVASRWHRALTIEEEFNRTFNELFEDLLIRRWRAPGEIRTFGNALVLEDEDSYRVRLALPEAEPAKLEVEASEWRLTVRSPSARGQTESKLDFSHRIDPERVTAHFEAGILDVTVPKARGRKIEVR